jgi:5-methylcytosine-specific restriction endonuclease McrA
MTAPRGIKQQILDLRAEGKTYNEICAELKCSKGTVCYHLGSGVKERIKAYRETNKTMITISKKIDRFSKRKSVPTTNPISRELKLRIRNKVNNFTRREELPLFTYEELINKIGSTPKCYLTGEKIDLDNTKDWHLDHIIPVSKGGDNSLKNCNIATREANLAKTDMSLDDFVEFCQKVVDNNQGAKAGN